MVLSVVNLQEAYAKALLVDRDALRAAQRGGRRARRPRGPARRLQHRRPPALREARAALGAAEDPIAALRASGYAERVAERDAEREQETDAMSTVTPI